MPLVTRNNPKLTLEGARAVLAAAEKRAQEIGVPMDIAVVDDGGHLLAFIRMDGAKLSSVQIALTKAVSAGIRRMPTDPMPPGAEPNLLLSLLLPSAARVSRRRSAEACRWWWTTSASGPSASATAPRSRTPTWPAPAPPRSRRLEPARRFVILSPDSSGRRISGVSTPEIPRPGSGLGMTKQVRNQEELDVVH